MGEASGSGGKRLDEGKTFALGDKHLDQGQVTGSGTSIWVRASIWIRGIHLDNGKTFGWGEGSTELGQASGSGTNIWIRNKHLAQGEASGSRASIWIGASIQIRGHLKCQQRAVRKKARPDFVADVGRWGRGCDRGALCGNVVSQSCHL